MTNAERPAGGVRWRAFLGLAAVIVVFDQLTKAWLVATIDPGEVIVVLGDLLRLVHSQNSGAIFGLFRDNALVFGALSILVVGLIIGIHGRSAPSRATSIAFGLLLGGAIGNLIDRFRLGHVVDFVDMGIGDWRWYTFNVADAAISASIVAFLILAIWPGVGQAIDRLGTSAEAIPGEQPSDG